jgi:hypothetical protein
MLVAHTYLYTLRFAFIPRLKLVGFPAHKIINRKKIREMCDWLKFYDENGYFPFDKVPIKKKP